MNANHKFVEEARALANMLNIVANQAEKTEDVGLYVDKGFSGMVSQNRFQPQQGRLR